ncbi:hypothetical protein SAMN04488115_10990 [Bosea lathyri]|uniref:Uncharacterized protein n=1 Tax=Bosea lathyri TaxID=1036778 RepID=A0A1H6C7F1_9HYPH|nr:hypothetical protein SAMN04488115_10990 [Bosea lathyri]
MSLSGYRSVKDERADYSTTPDTGCSSGLGDTSDEAKRKRSSAPKRPFWLRA